MAGPLDVDRVLNRVSSIVAGCPVARQSVRRTWNGQRAPRIAIDVARCAACRWACDRVSEIDSWRRPLSAARSRAAAPHSVRWTNARNSPEPCRPSGLRARTAYQHTRMSSATGVSSTHAGITRWILTERLASIRSCCRGSSRCRRTPRSGPSASSRASAVKHLRGVSHMCRLHEVRGSSAAYSSIAARLIHSRRTDAP